MKRLAILAALVSCTASADTYVDNLYWQVSGQTYGRQWGDTSGRWNIQTYASYSSTALNLFPTLGISATGDSLSEITLHRIAYQNTSGMERLNVSAMSDAVDGGDYRIGVERSGAGQFHPIRFCFENVTPGVAVCPLRITLEGVFINVGGQWRPVAYQ